MLPYSGLHLAGVSATPSTSGYSPCLSTARPCIPDLYCDWLETDRYCWECLNISFHNAHLFRLSTHVARFRLSTRVICLHIRIAVFLFTQLEHEGSVKGQYSTPVHFSPLFLKRTYSFKKYFKNFLEKTFLQKKKQFRMVKK